jgi:acetyl esterase/lipase
MSETKALTLDEVHRLTAEAGPGAENITPPEVRAYYVDQIHEKSREDLQVWPDVLYGPDPRHDLDIYVPRERPATALPVVMFFFGGGFLEGSKNRDGQWISGNVAAHFARHQMIGITANYRLAPEFQWPEGSRDVARAVGWVQEHIGEYGGDPDRIALMGHSSGASHVASYALRDDLCPAEGQVIKAAILLSGAYAPNPAAPDPRQTAYYGEDTSKYAEMGSLGNVRSSVPVFILVAENDVFNFQLAATKLIAEVTAHQRKAPWFKMLHGHNHVTPLFSIDTDDPTVGPELIEFVRRYI